MKWHWIWLLILTWRVGASPPPPSPQVSPNDVELAKPSRVVVVHNPAATLDFEPNFDQVRLMIGAGLKALTDQTNEAQAWRALVSLRDTIGIKVCAAPGNIVGTRPAVVRAVIESLLRSGYSPSKLIIWDRRLSDLRKAGFDALAQRYGVGLDASLQAGYDTNAFYSSTILGKLLWGDLEFGKTGEGIGRSSYVTKLLTQKITKIIQITPLLNHNAAGVSGNLYTLAFASVDNTLRFENADNLAQAVPEIYALPQIGDKVALNIVDALIGQYQGEDTPMLHYSSALNELRFSRDPVALDALSLETLKALRGETTPSFRSKAAALIYDNANLLELGESHIKRLEVLRIEQPE